MHLLIAESAPSRGCLRGKYKQRTDPPSAIVIHTTGPGPVKRWQNGEHASPFDAALHIYQHLMDAGPHFVIGQDSRLASTCPINRCAWHVGGKGSMPYRSGVLGHGVRGARYAWWRERWSDLASPLDLAGGLLWLGGSCNANTIGIEVVPQIDASEAWSDASIAVLGALVTYLCGAYDIPFDRYHVITHSDAHPRARTTATGMPWDPSPGQLSLARIGIV